MTKEKKILSVQEKLELIIEKNKNEASALQKIIDAIERETKKPVTK